MKESEKGVDVVIVRDTTRLARPKQSSALQNFIPSFFRQHGVFIQSANEGLIDPADSHRLLLRMMVDYAVENGQIVSNPLLKAKHLQAVRVRFRRDLTREEVDALLKCATDTYRLMWFPFVSTGARKEELVSLRAEDVNLEKQQIRLREGEGRELKTATATRTIPIGDELAQELAAQMPQTGYVFPTKNGGKRSNNVLRELKRHMAAALKSLGWGPENITKEMRRLDIHSLRYTFITELIDSGVNPKVVQQLAGHKDIKTTLAIYAQCRPASVDSADANLPWSLKSSHRIAT